MQRLVISFFLLLFPFASYGLKEMTDLEVKKLIIKGNINAFEAECPCPYSEGKTTVGECGQNSAYFTYTGANKPYCYPEDIPTSKVDEYRAQYGIPKMNDLDKPLNQ